MPQSPGLVYKYLRLHWGLMVLFHNPREYVYNLYTTSSSEAKRLWRKHIKESWENKCAYCESEENITIDHIVPQSKGGLDTTRNVVGCCHSCNQSKGHTPWEDWYENQDFFSEARRQKIEEWMRPPAPTNLYSYRPRRNNLT